MEATQDLPPSFQDHPLFSLSQPPLSSLLTSFPLSFLTHRPLFPRWPSARAGARASRTRIDILAFSDTCIGTRIGTGDTGRETVAINQ